jgi:cytochrome c oxidase subunit 2
VRVHLYEKLWIVLGIAMLAVFLGVLTVAAFAAGRQPPGQAELIRPEQVMSDPRLAPAGVRQVGPGRYEVRMVAMTFTFLPNEIRIPRGAEVDFVIASADVIHGFEVVGTNVNGMVIPGRITRLNASFDRPGEYLIVCNEYCGAGHQAMKAKLIVE